MTQPEEAAQARGAGTLEKHVQTILLAVITAGIVGGAAFFIGAREDAVRFGAQISHLAAEVTAMRSEVALMRNSYVNRDEWRDHESRLRALEHRQRTQP